MGNISSLEQLMELEGEAFVTACYVDLIGRLPDYQGLQHHVAMLEKGTSKLQIALGFAQSEEVRYLRRQDNPLVMSVLAAQEQANGARASMVRFFKRRLRPQPQPQPQPQLAPRPVVAGVTRLRVEAVDVPRSAPGENASIVGPLLWFDLSSSFYSMGQPNPIVRGQLRLAAILRKTVPSIRFFVRVECGFAEVPAGELGFLFAEGDAVDNFSKRFGITDATATRPPVRVKVPAGADLSYPFSEIDTVLLTGWMDGLSEVLLSRIRQVLPALDIAAYLHDTALAAPDTKHFYGIKDVRFFHQYLEWVAHVCDRVYCGSAAAGDVFAAIAKQFAWPAISVQVVPPGSELLPDAGESSKVDENVRKLADEGHFFLVLGDIEPQHNHETIYRAYVLAQELSEAPLPKIVFAGHPGDRVQSFLDTLARNPQVSADILIIKPSPSNVEFLLQNCLMLLSPSLDQSWRQPMTRAFAHGKAVIAVDMPLQVELGRGLATFVDPYDVRAWAEAMLSRLRDDADRVATEAIVRRDWRSRDWEEVAAILAEDFTRRSSPVLAQPARGPYEICWDVPKPAIWMDLTLTFLHWDGNIGGIVRAELTFAYYLKNLEPSTRFFASSYAGFFEIDPEYLWWLLAGDDLTTSYKMFQEYWREQESSGTAFRDPFRLYPHPPSTHPAYLQGFPENSAVFFAAIDFAHIDPDGKPELHRVKDVLALADRERDVMLSQLIYDFTPILFPHVHKRETCDGYRPFIEFVSNNFDHLIYGGRTARRDGWRFQKQNALKSPPSDFVEFGSDLALVFSGKNEASNDVASPAQPSATGKARASDAEASEVSLRHANGSSIARRHSSTSKKKSDANVLARLGIHGKFVITVGTVEPRKNHEVLYKAFIEIQRRSLLEKPLQLVIVGPRGWKSDEFLDLLAADDRMADTILPRTPTDDELEVLYRNCEFTLLPSFYEGWSLTLPESLSHGKFCLACDCDPLRETGGDLAEYIHPLDPVAWARAIAYYGNNPDQLAQRTALVRDQWHARTWLEATQMLTDALHKEHRAQFGLSRLASYLGSMSKVMEV